MDQSNVSETSQEVLVAKNPPANEGDIRDRGSIPGLRRSTGGGKDNPLQYSCLKNPMDKGTWWAVITVGHDPSNLAQHTKVSGK